MKKVLLVLGLAMCGSLAFAQTNNNAVRDGISRDALTPTGVRHVEQPADEQTDYKASIFTKEKTVVTTFMFDNEDPRTAQIVIGQVQSGDPSVFGSAHTIPTPKSYWIHVDTIGYLMTTGFNTTYNLMCSQNFIGLRNNIIRYMDTAYGDHQNNGFMMVSNMDAGGIVNGGVPYVQNSYFALPQVTLPNTCVMPSVRFFQFYRKFYDKCYLDYKEGNTWKTVEINVTGVDMDVNTNNIGWYETILPHAVATQHTLDLRFRAFDAGGHQASGYVWAVDAVEIVSSDATYDWAFQSEGFLDGFYGLVPPGFNLPMAYTIKARNLSIGNISGVHLDVEHRFMNESGEWEASDFELVRGNQRPIPAGDIEAKVNLRINERGFMIDTLGLSNDGAGGPRGDTAEAYFQCLDSLYDPNVYGVDGADLPNTYEYVGLPTENVGKNQFDIYARANNDLDTLLNRMTYQVSRWIDTTPTNKAHGITVPGYRWGHDNGVIPTGYEFAYQFITEEGQVYFTDDPDEGGQFSPGYQVQVRFNTPSEAPIDPLTGDTMVIRGLELIPSTRLTAADLNHALITPFATFDLPDTTGEWHEYYLENYTGINHNTQISVDGSKFADRDTLGYWRHTDNYHAVNILFPGQPAIWPNMTYYFGYAYQGGQGVFSLAEQQTYYRRTDAPDSSRRYRDEPALADYANQYWPNLKVADVYAYHSEYSRYLNGWNISEYPLVRLIVGPKMQIAQATVEAECNEDDQDTVNRYWIGFAGTNMCVEGVDVEPEGSTVAYVVYPGSPEENEEGDYIYDNGNVIDHIYVTHNGTTEEYRIDGSDNRVEAVAYNVVDASGTLLTRNKYNVYLENMTGEYVISAHAYWAGLAVTPVETQVNLALAPNPATSQVRLNISGVTGKVNCNILDMSGRVIYNADFNAESEQLINLNGVPAGAYFVRVTGDTFSKVERLIVR